jgi:PKD repeat protein/plastocyanin
MTRVPAAAVLVVLGVSIGCDDRPPTGPGASPAVELGPGAPGVHQATDTVEARVFDWRFAPTYMTVRQGTTVLWEFLGPKGHTVEDVSGLELYDSGSEGGAGRPGDSLAFRFTSAGRYEFHCDPHPDLMKGSIEVPLEVSPASGVLGAAFLVQWASETPGAAYAVDVQVKRPGNAAFESWMTGRKDRSAYYTPSAVGKYEFRGRLRKTGGATSQWSTGAFVVVVEAGATNLPPVAGMQITCTGLMCLFGDASADPDGAIAAWTWDVGDGTAADVPEFPHTYATRTKFTLSLVVTDDWGSVSGPYTRTMTPFNSAPTPVFTHACTDLTCAFMDASFDVDGTVTGWSWDFGDGATDTTPNPVHTFADEGTFGVRFQVRDNSGFWGALDTIPLNVTAGNTGPIPLFTYACTGVVCSFTDLSMDTDGSVVAWSWEFKDGGTSTEQNPVHPYAANGDYTVGLAVTDNGGLTSSSFTKVVKPRSPVPVAAFTALCRYLECTFTDGSTDGDGAVTAWSWTFGDGQTSTSQNPVHTYGANGAYTATLTVTDQYGSVSAPSAQTHAVAANVAPTAAFTAVCLQLACAFTDGTTDGDGTVVGWIWDFGDGNGSTEQSPAHTFGADGTYAVTLTATDDAGATGAPFSSQVTVAENFAPTAAFSVSCLRLDCVFTDASSDPDGSIVSWTWDFGDGTGSAEPSPSHRFVDGGSYTVTLLVADNGGKTGGPAAQMVNVAGNQLPTAAFTVSCAYRTCTFTDASGDPEGPVAGWSWDFGDGNGSTAASPVHTFGADGAFTVTLAVTDGDGAASAPAQQVVTVAANQAPVASFTWSCNASRLCTFNGSGSTDDVGIVTYTWFVSGRQFATGVTATRQFTRAGAGSITLTVTDGLGLTGTITQIITVP